MRHSTVGFSDDNTDYIFYKTFMSKGVNTNNIDRMKKLLGQAIANELTDRQRQCITLYYYDNMKMYNIAQRLSLSPSTVTRHIKAGVKKLKNVARYY